MFLRIAALLPLAMAATLPAQIGQTPVAKPAETTPAETKPQEPTPAQKLESLKREKARLVREIEFAKKRVTNASGLMSKKLQRGKPDFKAIDAGKPERAMPIAPKPVQRKFARIGTEEEMKYGGEVQMLKVNQRAISQAHFDRLVSYLAEYKSSGTDELRAQRVLFDLIRTEAVASQFIENEGEVKLAEWLEPLNSGTRTIEDAAKEVGSVQAAQPDGSVTVTRNSIHGPMFEYMAFTTPVGKLSQPFRNAFGYVLLKVDSIEKGETPEQDKVQAHAVQFNYAADRAVVQKAQYNVNTGQSEVLVRDQQVLDLLPALFKPAPPPPSPKDQYEMQIKQLEQRLESMGEREGAEQQVEMIKNQIKTLKERLKALEAGNSDADTGAGPGPGVKLIREGNAGKAPGAIQRARTGTNTKALELQRAQYEARITSLQTQLEKLSGEKGTEKQVEMINKQIEAMKARLKAMDKQAPVPDSEAGGGANAPKSIQRAKGELDVKKGKIEKQGGK